MVHWGGGNVCQEKGLFVGAGECSSREWPFIEGGKHSSREGHSLREAREEPLIKGGANFWERRTFIESRGCSSGEDNVCQEKERGPFVEGGWLFTGEEIVCQERGAVC